MPYKEREAIWMPDASLADSSFNRNSAWPAPPANEFPRGAKRGNDGRPKAPQSKGQQPKSGGTANVKSVTKDGREICEKFNRGQCSDPCPAKRLHVCNAAIKGGRACGLRGHTSGQCRNRRML